MSGQPPTTSARSAGGMSPITKPMFGMKFVTNARIAQTAGAGHAEGPQREAVDDRHDRAEARVDDVVAADAGVERHEPVDAGQHARAERLLRAGVARAVRRHEDHVREHEEERRQHTQHGAAERGGEGEDVRRIQNGCRGIRALLIQPDGLEPRDSPTAPSPAARRRSRRRAARTGPRRMPAEAPGTRG